MALAEATGLREACDRAAPERKDQTAQVFQPLASAAGACHEFLAAPGQHRILIGSASSMVEPHVRKDPERLCGADLKAGVDRALPLFAK